MATLANLPGTITLKTHEEFTRWLMIPPPCHTSVPAQFPRLAPANGYDAEQRGATAAGLPEALTVVGRASP